MKKAVKIILITLGSFVALFLMICIFIWINSPGKLKPLKDEQGHVISTALTEKNWLEINGIQQGYFIRSENPENPVILFLHGGPGSPELPLIEASEKAERLEKYFTLCYWDQRAAGMSFSSDIDSISLNDFVEDTRVMTEYLMQKFGKQKIYLMGHSWGSYLGVKVAERYPEFYHAYIGIGQVTNQRLSEQLAYDYMLNHAREIDDKKAVEVFEQIDKNAASFPDNAYLMGARSAYMNKYGVGVVHENASMGKLIWDVFMFKGYTFSEKLKYPQGNLFALENVFPYVLEDNLFESSSVFSLPIYVVHGAYDYQVSHQLAQQWMDSVDAPEKAFYSFGNSAHSPNMEESENFIAVVKHIAERANN